ncbi:MAG: hypothetical protein IJS61_01370 [Firmicutes bacterium]|nr:hypothetical protein [Bacillota bacterium]
MDIYNTVIENTDTPEIQELLRKLDKHRDVLMTSLSPSVPGQVDIQFIEPINTIRKLGNIPDYIMEDIRKEYGTENVTVDVSEYMVTYENGAYGLVVDLSVSSTALVVNSKKRLPLIFIILIGIATGFLTLVLIVLKFIDRVREK